MIKFHDKRPARVRLVLTRVSIRQEIRCANAETEG